MGVPSTAPAALLIDDGELEQFARVLRRMGVDHVRLDGSTFRPVTDRPRDLLITTWQKAGHLPQLEPDGDDAWEPTWLCVHHQDFLPLRKRMRAMGIHYLVHSALDRESLRLLVGQLLYRGAERRGARRLPVGCEVSYRSSDGRRKALLAELSEDCVRLLTTHDLAPDAPIRLTLPVALGMGPGVELGGRVLRCSPWEPEGREPALAVVVLLDEMPPEQRLRLVRFLQGRQLGSRVTPLGTPPPRALDPPTEPPPKAPSAPTAPAAAAASDEVGDVAAGTVSWDDELPEVALDRRATRRGAYRRQVPTLCTGDADAPNVVLGCDLSRTGMRIARHDGLRVGSRFAVAVHDGSRAEPLVIQAEVARDDGVRGFGLRFEGVTPEIERRLETLLERLQPLESLCEGDPEGEGLVVSRLIRESGDR